MSAGIPSPLELNVALEGRNTLTPSRKVFVLFTAVHWARTHSVDWLEAIEHGLKAYKTAPLDKLSSLEPLDSDWDPFSVFSELLVADLGAPSLSIVKKQLFGVGYEISLPHLHDISTAFVNTRLSAAVHSFDPRIGEGKELPWLSTVLYRYSLRHAAEARRLSPLLELADSALPSELRTPEAEVERMQREHMLSELAATLGLLREPEQKALALYFGFLGVEATIAEVAKSLGTSNYYAKLTLATAMAGVAAHLGASGLLSEQELRVARALREMNEEDAARYLELPRELVQREAREITRKLTRVLRRRTTSRESKQGEMMDQELKYNLFLQDLRLRQFRIYPRQEYCWQGRATGLMPLERARELLNPHAEQLLRTDAQLEPIMNELYAPRIARSDLSEEEVAWLARVERSNATSLQQVQEFIETVPDVSMEPYQADDEADSRSTAERFYDSLVSVSTALEKLIPFAERRDGRGILHLWIEGDDILAKDGSESPAESLRNLIEERMQRIGHFNIKVAKALASATFNSLVDGRLSLPQFTWRQSRGRHIELLWERAAISKGE